LAICAYVDMHSMMDDASRRKERRMGIEGVRRDR